jgi:hypothetical protein
MNYRFLLLFSAISLAAAQTAPPPPVQHAPAVQAPSAAPQAPVIRFEDASNKAGINFTHSFGSRQLGSLLEGTGAGCIWFDYNNSGLESLYVVNGRPLDDSMHPYPLKDKPATPPHNHLYRNNGNGTFTDVTEQAGLNPDMYGVAVTAADYDNDGFVDLLVTGYGKTILYHRCDQEGRDQCGRLGDQFHLARLRQGWMRRSFRRPLREVRSQVSRLLRGGQLPRSAGL